MSQSIKPKKPGFRDKVFSEPFKNRKLSNEQTNTNESTENKSNAEPQHSKAFPKRFTCAAYLDVRTNPAKSWKRKYFVLANNFLLCAATEHALKLEKAAPLEGSNVRSSTQTTDMTFQLLIRKKPIFFRAASPKQCELWTRNIQRASALKIKDIYRFLYQLGMSESQNTKVIAARHQTTNEDCAIKIVNKKLCDQRMLRTEIEILKNLDNEYIVKLYDLFETKKFLYIVMEKCEGGELFDQIAALDGEHYTEQDTCHIMHQLAKGITYMHSVGMVHRDLKPENVLCVDRKSIRKVKLADFGISKLVKGNRPMKTMCGTLSYTAPEILRGKPYDKAVDYWSLGVIMFILLCGYPPFWGDSDQEIKNEIVMSELELDPDDWEHVSKETIELVKGLLDKNPRKRKTANDVLALTWKVSSACVSFKKSYTKLRQTVVKRKMLRRSMGVFETSSSAMSRLYHDDLVKMRQSSGTNIEEAKKKKIKQTEFGQMKRGSKTADQLELTLPYRRRESFERVDEEKEFVAAESINSLSSRSLIDHSSNDTHHSEDDTPIPTT